MMQVQALIGDLNKGHLGSPEVTNSANVPNVSRFRKARGVRMFSFFSLRHDTSIDKQLHLCGLSRDIDLRSNVDLDFQGRHAYFSTFPNKGNTMASKICHLLS